jgi:hypothetical protein
MAYTVEQVATLEAAIAQGATSVQYADKKVEYRTLADMRSVLNDMKNELGLLTGKKRRFFPSFNKGLNSCNELY